MVSVFSYDTVCAEQAIIEDGCRREVADRTEERLDFIKALSREGWPAGTGGMDIIFCEIQNSDDVQALKQLRKGETEALLMLLASATVSPTQYLKPGIAPDLLLLRPFSAREFEKANGELFDAFSEKREAPGEVFVRNTRDGRICIPYSRISYFEARNKKINVRAGNEEYDFYDSIENILQMLPENFVRCHRAYLVNARKIREVRTSEGIVELDGGVQVPFSRTYRQSLKDLMG